MSMPPQERVRCAIEFRQPDRVPVVFWNRDQEQGDVLLYHLALGVPGEGSVNACMACWAPGTAGLSAMLRNTA
jgi:hypothetical protein